MKSLPKIIIRLDDGMEFVLDERTDKYSVRTGIPKIDDQSHYHHQYSYELLMESPANKGMFKISDGTEDIKAMKDAWFKRFKNAASGCGDEDDGC